MKRNLRLWACSLVVWNWVAAEPMTDLKAELPTFSRGQLEAAFNTRRAPAEEAAETQRAFPVKYGLIKYGLTHEPLSEGLERCVLSVLQGNTVEMMPLG